MKVRVKGEEKVTVKHGKRGTSGGVFSPESELFEHRSASTTVTAAAAAAFETGNDVTSIRKRASDVIGASPPATTSATFRFCFVSFADVDDVMTSDSDVCCDVSVTSDDTESMPPIL